MFSDIKPISVGVGALFALPPFGYKLYKAYIEEEYPVQTVKYQLASVQSIVSLAVGVLTGIYTEIVCSDDKPLGARVVVGVLGYGLGIYLDTLAFNYEEFPLTTVTYRGMIERERRISFQSAS